MAAVRRALWWRCLRGCGRGLLLVPRRICGGCRCRVAHRLPYGGWPGLMRKAAMSGCVGGGLAAGTELAPGSPRWPLGADLMATTSSPALLLASPVCEAGIRVPGARGWLGMEGWWVWTRGNPWSAAASTVPPALRRLLLGRHRGLSSTLFLRDLGESPNSPVGW